MEELDQLEFSSRHGSSPKLRSEENTQRSTHVEECCVLFHGEARDNTATPTKLIKS